jgi:hypothetical protein
MEDDPIVRANIESALIGAGASLVRAGDPKIDAAILDVSLGQGYSSIAIAEALSHRGVPFAFFTGLNDKALGPIKNRWPACQILKKPATSEQIVAAVVNLLASASNQRSGPSTQSASRGRFPAILEGRFRRLSDRLEHPHNLQPLSLDVLRRRRERQEQEK